ncbi:hypothetical protein BV25DRAFT_1634423 [Artomyces pyxidatus]|uniref:Uncharacterized protein n=1 Tax=Artomyces pyxidatus TaxID=48021 RepID=A0ACB8SIR7_9AGAM|nr:hypothetical protein BV25DRAFT_1634423 [Artomyces pyxidatus]
MSTVATAALTSPPTPFASLLRRSKFASYDPQIAQVYTTSSANAHRGNWGVKRPLALRKPGRFIAIQAVDSREQQTEWRHGQQEALFVERWPELGVRTLDRGSWEKHVGVSNRARWMLDSEFLVDQKAAEREAEAFAAFEEERTTQTKGYKAAPPRKKPTEVWDGVPVRRVSAMTQREYARYMDDLRAQRPAFQEFLVEQTAISLEKQLAGKRQHPIRPTPYEEVPLSSAKEVRNLFLKGAAHRPPLAQQPHRTAGLQYASESPLTQFFTSRPQPGRFLTEKAVRYRPLGVSGVIMGSGSASNITDPPPNPMFRPTFAHLIKAPRTVGKNESHGLEAVVIEARAFESSQLSMTRRNPHRPGSREWIEASGPTKKKERDMTRTPTGRSGKRDLLQPAAETSPVKLMDTLNAIMSQQTQPE